MAQNGKVLALDGVENFLATPAEEFEIDGQVRDPLSRSAEGRAGTSHGPALLRTSSCRKRTGYCDSAPDLLGDRVLAQVFERQIDSAFGVVDGYVLPEVRQLQCGAGVIGKLLALGIAITAKVEHKMSDRIRGVTAVGQDVVESFEAGDSLILAEGDEEVREFMFRNLELFDGFSQGDETGCRGVPL